MGGFELGLVVPSSQYGPERRTVGWPEMRAIALRAEAAGFDTIWVADELLWRPDGQPQQGMWEGVSLLGAIAAVTTTATIGSWVMSALHRNPGIIAKAIETVDEISGGRAIFGLGAGHAWPGQARAYGLPEDRIFDRFEEALAIIVPLLRTGHADVQGTYHAAHDLDQVPRGPQAGRMPLLIGGNGPKGQRHAVRHADIWSGYVEERAHVDEVGPRIASLEAICAEEGRDPASIGRSIGVGANPTLPAGSRAGAMTGTPREIADGLLSFRDAGYTRAELMFGPPTIAAVDALAETLALVRAG